MSKFNQEIRTCDVTSLFSPNNGNSNTSTYAMFDRATALKQLYTSIDNPQVDFWRIWAEYTVPANELTRSDVDITYTPNPV